MTSSPLVLTGNVQIINKDTGEILISEKDYNVEFVNTFIDLTSGSIYDF
jgi:hypothetical protein